MIMALSLRVIVTCFLIITTTTASSSSPPGGFTTDLIHRRSQTTSSRLSNDGSSPYADTVFDTNLYLMKLQIGTPPVEIEAELDTGSELIWTQCLPCLNCYDQVAPIFDPSKSSTYIAGRCDSSPDHSCPYEATYYDQSYTKGTFASETVTIQSTSGQPFVMPKAIIGCGHNNSGFRPPVAGIVGLNRGSLSLISQMGENYLGLLSYCLSGNGTSKINFGGNAIVAGDGTVAADMFQKTDKPNFYYLNLDAISVGDNRVETLGTSFHAADGNIIIDSGTTYTYLPGSYCSQVKDAVKSAVQAEPSPYTGSMLCYNTDTTDIFPVITMHFAGGADLELDKYNTYEDMGKVFCLTITCLGPTENAVFGNRAQNNWLVGYDPFSELISFKSTDCSALWS